MANEYLLLEAYRTLTFRHQNSPDDHSRFEAFKLLVMHHLLSFEFVDYHGKPISGPKLDSTDWDNAANKHKCLYSFLTTHGQKLWPGKVAERTHLEHQAVKTKDRAYIRSFIAGYDGKWSSNRRNVKKGYANSTAIPQDEYELAGMSRIGLALRAYIEVLLGGALVREWLKAMDEEEVLVEMATKPETVAIAVQGEMTREDYIALGLTPDDELGSEAEK